MDATLAERLASSTDPKGLSALAGQTNDRAVAKAVAEQFGSFLMQGLLQQSDGSALPMAGDGIGGDTVSSMFATTMGRVAMSGDKLGLADVLLRSMDAKQNSAGGNGGQAPSPATAAAPATAPAPALAPARAPASPTTPAASSGFPLAPYWRSNGQRPIGSTTGRANAVPLAQPNGSAPAKLSLPPQPPQPAPSAAGSPTAPAPAGAASTASTASTASASEITNFVNQIAPSLQKAAAALGVSPKILLAQAALETGWGRSVVGNNVFGVKAGTSWSGSVVQAATHETQGGRTVARDATFRSYPTIAAAAQDYASLIAQSGRYRGVVGAGDDVAAYARGLASGGYATDSNYAAKLQAVAASPALATAVAALPGSGAMQLAAAED